MDSNRSVDGSSVVGPDAGERETTTSLPTAEPGLYDPAVAATILVVDGDDALSYLLERYSNRGGFRFCEVHVPWQAPQFPPAGPAALWLPSIERLEALRPREMGVGDDVPVIVCSFVGDEARAHDLGADFCAFHPLQYRDFLAALRAVGITDQSGAIAERGPTA